MVIYKITNKVNGKCYIGQTVQSLEARWSKHKAKNSGCPLLSRAIKKYGAESFTVDTVSGCASQEQLNDSEIFFIDYFQALTPDGYNIAKGGDNSTGIKGLVRSEEMRRKLSESKTGKPNGHLGLKRPAATGIKISKALAGNKNALGAVRSEETRAKMSAAKKGISHPAHSRIKIVDSVTGEIFESIKSAASKIKITQQTLSAMLLGRQENTSTLTYYNAQLITKKETSKCHNQ